MFLEIEKDEKVSAREGTLRFVALIFQRFVTVNELELSVMDRCFEMTVTMTYDVWSSLIVRESESRILCDGTVEMLQMEL